MSSIPLVKVVQSHKLDVKPDQHLSAEYNPFAHLPAIWVGSSTLPGVHSRYIDVFLYDDGGVATAGVQRALAEDVKSMQGYEGCGKGTILATFHPAGTQLNLITTANTQFFEAQRISQSVMQFCNSINPNAFTKREARHGLFKIIETELLRTEPFNQADHDALNKELK